MGIQRFASCNLSLVNSIHDGVILASERPEPVARGKRSATPGSHAKSCAPWRGASNEAGGQANGARWE